MGAVVCIVIIALLFLVMSVALFFGKGSWLIAGFNTASAEKKAAFDKKKLCRAMSVLCFVVAVLLSIMAYLGYQVETGSMAENDMLYFGIIFMVTIITTLILVVRYANTRCKK